MEEHSASASASSVRTACSEKQETEADLVRRQYEEAKDELEEEGVQVDRYGFYTKASHPALTKQARETEKRRAWKWQRMAQAREGGFGKTYSFPMSRKLVLRTLKGIPDCWRSSAWHSFLTDNKHSPSSDLELVQMYHHLSSEPSTYDSQIDLDIPRTISQHVLFSQRYGMGQRLLFRTLHALSLYLGEIGYVQGMATLAATLLCYYDEEMAFVMLVRMFEERGLSELYAPGFEGLLAEFSILERDMKRIRGGRCLLALNIQPLSFATRWYLTLYANAVSYETLLQVGLRGDAIILTKIWDVFMLMGRDVLRQTALAAINALHIQKGEDFDSAMVKVCSLLPPFRMQKPTFPFQRFQSLPFT